MENKSEQAIKMARKIGVNVGKNCKFSPTIHWGSEPFLITIGNQVLISYMVDFITHDGGTWVFRNLPQYKGIMKIGRIIIQDNCMIGAHSIILPGVIIGKNCVVGAGSVVTKSLKPNGVYAGNPAKFICSINDYVKKSVENNKKYNKNYIKTDDRQKRILSLIEGYDEYKPFI